MVVKLKKKSDVKEFLSDLIPLSLAKIILAVILRARTFTCINVTVTYNLITKSMLQTQCNFQA